MIRPAKGGDRRSVAIMQPYFYPYLPYFALFAAADTFVIYDCVQFPRRGRVHRTEVARNGANAHWLTLPLRHQSRDTLIRDLAFAPAATGELHARVSKLIVRLPILRNLPAAIIDHLFSDLSDPVDYLEQGLRVVGRHIGLEPTIVRSSALAIDPMRRGQERIIAIANALGADRYVNASGGRSLYDPAAFASHGLSLEFIPPYAGSQWHALPALAAVSADELRAQVLALADGRGA